jgi:hypothetical protein
MLIRSEIETTEEIYIEPVSTGNSVRLLLSKRHDVPDELKDLERMVAEIAPYRC